MTISLCVCDSVCLLACVFCTCVQKKSLFMCVCLFVILYHCVLIAYIYVCVHLCKHFFFFLMGVCVYFHMCVRPAVGDKVSV